MPSPECVLPGPGRRNNGSIPAAEVDSKYIVDKGRSVETVRAQKLHFECWLFAGRSTRIACH